MHTCRHGQTFTRAIKQSFPFSCGKSRQKGKLLINTVFYPALELGTVATAKTSHRLILFFQTTEGSIEWKTVRTEALCFYYQMSAVHLRKYGSEMFPSVRLEGFGQQRTAIQSNFNEKCEGIDRIWV